MTLVCSSVGEAWEELAMMHSVPEVISFFQVVRWEIQRVSYALVYVGVVYGNPVRRWLARRRLSSRLVSLGAIAGLVEERFMELCDEPALPATRRAS